MQTDEYRFVCDQMVLRLGKWLRAAGYDTIFLYKTASDRELLNFALKENRLLITRDREFLEMSIPKGHLIFLNSNTVQSCIQELNGMLNIDWLHAPFSRCMVCNTVLDPSTDLTQVPEDIQAKTVMFCPNCKKVFWEGSHTKRMLQQLKLWNAKL